MRKDEFNTILRVYVRDHLSPTTDDRTFVAEVYSSVQDVLGAGNCLQIGSFARFTAIRPLHDLDILYIAGTYENEDPDPSGCLASLEERLLGEYQNPTDYDFEISTQTHSVTISFRNGDEDVFSVDVVPAYRSGRNEFDLDKYVVPEIAAMGKARRTEIRDQVSRGERQMHWIHSDPRGYIQIASHINAANEDFRRTAKLLKGWRSACKEVDPEFSLKSFHLEQAIAVVFSRHPNISIFDAAFEVMCQIPDLIRYPRFPDRANPNVFIDSYVDELSHADQRKVDKARDHFLVQLENLAAPAGIPNMLSGVGYERASSTEKFLFDQNIPVLSEVTFRVVGDVQEKTGGFRAFILDRVGRIPVSREIRFRVGRDAPDGCMFKWKVRNDRDSPEPRGEITDHQTLKELEKTAYIGTHWVECFAVRDGVCVGRGKQVVRLGSLVPEA